MKAPTIYCAGSNRFGAACTNRVTQDGGYCGRCRGSASDRPSPAAGRPREATPTPPPILSLPSPDEDWTPAAQLRDRLAPIAADNPDLVELVEVSARLVANTKARNTKAAYQQHRRTFERFCEKVGLDPTPPIAPETICLFLAFLTIYRRHDRSTGQRVQDGDPLAHSYLRAAVSALGHWHTTLGLPDPTEDPVVSAVLEGYGKTYGTTADGVDPITLDRLGTICTPLSTPPATHQRDLLILLLATNPDLNLGAAQIAGLDHSRILLPETVLDPAQLLISSQGTKSLRPFDLPREAIREICSVQALLAIVTDDAGPLLQGPNGRLTAEGIIWIVNDLVRRSGVKPVRHARRLPKLSADDRLKAAQLLLQPADADLRDRAIVTSLFWGCFRGEELARTLVHELRFVNHGIEWGCPKKKNHQRRDSPPRGVPRADDPFVCAVTAVSDWLERLSLLHRRPLRPDDPVFPPLRQRSSLDRPMSRAGINEVVQKLAKRAGLVGTYGSHSPRAGFVTTAIDASIPREQIQKHGDWVTAQGLNPYYRKTEVWSSSSNAAMQLARVQDHQS